MLDHFRQARLVPIALCILGASCGDDSALNPDNSDIYTTPQDSGRGPAKDTTLEDTGPAETPPGPAAMPYVHGTPTVDNFDHSLCYYFCHFNSHCSINFGGKAECYDSCHKMIADGKSANVACFVANCMSEEECLEDIPIPKACDDLCVNAGECPALAVLGMTPSPELCRVTCAGRAKAIPSFNDALECMVAPLRQCNLDAALECLADGATFCPLLCLEVADNPNFEREIDPECPWSAVYPTKEACFQHCSSMNAGQAFRAMKCFEDHECETTMACIEAPTSACAGYVEAVSQHCPATAFWPPSVTLAKVTCQEVFQGEFEGFPENLEMFPNCLETLNCNIDNRYVCLLPPDPRCEAICTAISDCGIFEYPECYGKCGSVSDPSDLDVIETCVSVSTCVEIEKCIDSAGQSEEEEHDSPNDVCTTWCNAQSECAIQSEVAPTACQSSCQATLDNQDVNIIWQLGCHSAGGCVGFESCLKMPLAINALCYERCNQSNACHHVKGPWDGGLSACAAYCSGMMHITAAQGQATTDDMAQCVVDLMGHDCAIADLSICVQ